MLSKVGMVSPLTHLYMACGVLKPIASCICFTAMPFSFLKRDMLLPVSFIFILIVVHITIVPFKQKPLVFLHFCFRQAVVIIRKYSGSVYILNLKHSEAESTAKYLSSLIVPIGSSLCSKYDRTFKFNFPNKFIVFFLLPQLI